MATIFSFSTQYFGTCRILEIGKKTSKHSKIKYLCKSKLSRDLIVKDKYTFQLKFPFQGECELLIRTQKAHIDSESRSVDSSVRLILDRMQPPACHSFDNVPEHTQSESLIYIEDTTIFGFNTVRTVI